MTLRKSICLVAVLLAAGCGSRNKSNSSDPSVDPVVPPMVDAGGTPDGGGTDGGGGGTDGEVPDGNLPPGWEFTGNECGVPIDGVVAGSADLDGGLPIRIRLAGVENPGYDDVKLDPHVEVWVDGDLAIDSGPGVIDLAEHEAFLLGQGILPADAQELRIRVTFDDFGAFCKGDTCADGGTIDARGLPIELTVSAWEFRQACHAVISLFLECSLVPQGDDLVLLPQLVARYW